MLEELSKNNSNYTLKELANRDTGTFLQQAKHLYITREFMEL
jgi:hypothetical protein